MTRPTDEQSQEAKREVAEAIVKLEEVQHTLFFAQYKVKLSKNKRDIEMVSLALLTPIDQLKKILGGENK